MIDNVIAVDFTPKKPPPPEPLRLRLFKPWHRKALKRRSQHG